MWIVFVVVVLGIAFFICIVNYIFRRAEYKNRSEWKKYNTFNSPTAWVAYAMCIVLIIGILLEHSLVNISTGFSNMNKAKDTITTSTDTTTTDTTSTDTTTTGTTSTQQKTDSSQK